MEESEGEFTADEVLESLERSGDRKEGKWEKGNNVHFDQPDFHINIQSDEEADRILMENLKKMMILIWKNDGKLPFLKTVQLLFLETFRRVIGYQVIQNSIDGNPKSKSEIKIDSLDFYILRKLMKFAVVPEKIYSKIENVEEKKIITYKRYEWNIKRMEELIGLFTIEYSPFVLCRHHTLELVDAQKIIFSFLCSFSCDLVKKQLTEFNIPLRQSLLNYDSNLRMKCEEVLFRIIHLDEIFDIFNSFQYFGDFGFSNEFREKFDVLNTIIHEKKKKMISTLHENLILSGSYTMTIKSFDSFSLFLMYSIFENDEEMLSELLMSLRKSIFTESKLLIVDRFTNRKDEKESIKFIEKLVSYGNKFARSMGVYFDEKSKIQTISFFGALQDIALLVDEILFSSHVFLYLESFLLRFLTSEDREYSFEEIISRPEFKSICIAVSRFLDAAGFVGHKTLSNILSSHLSTLIFESRSEIETKNGKLIKLYERVCRNIVEFSKDCYHLYGDVETHKLSDWLVSLGVKAPDLVFFEENKGKFREFVKRENETRKCDFLSVRHLSIGCGWITLSKQFIHSYRTKEMENYSDGFTLPLPILDGIKQYSSFYFTKYEGRYLYWLMNEGEATVKVNCRDGRESSSRYLVCSTYQMIILSLFNDHKRLSLREITKLTGIQFDQIKRSLGLLCKSSKRHGNQHNGVLKVEKSSRKTYFKPNDDFRSKQRKICMIDMSRKIRSQTKLREERVHKEIGNREMLICKAIKKVFLAADEETRFVLDELVRRSRFKMKKIEPRYVPSEEIVAEVIENGVQSGLIGKVKGEGGKYLYFYNVDEY